MLILSAISLIAMSLCKSYTLSLPICVAIGLTSVTPQLLVPFGAMLSEPSERGKNIGTIMSGLMIGMLASRVLSGVIGGYIGWQAIYVIASVVILILFVVLLKMLPNTERSSNINYFTSVKSLFSLPKKYPILLESAINGFLIFATFSAFWAVLTFYLEGDKFGFNSNIVGLFGLLGIAGAVMAPVAGRMSDSKGTRFTVLFHILVVIIAVAVLAILGQWIVGIVVGTILIDYGIQCCNVSNQARIQALSDEERNRITSVYMVCFFLGGASGSYLGSLLYDSFGWYGFVSFGGGLLIAALIVHLIFPKTVNNRTED